MDFVDRFFIHVVIIAAGICLPLGAFAQNDMSVSDSIVADPDDVNTIDGIITASYEVISGPAGEARNWDRERSLFHPMSRHIPTRPNSTGGSTADVQTVESFIERASPFFESNGFFEYEISREVQRFGDIAHVFSTYEWSRTEGGPVGGRGINSFQLVFDGERWWIVSVFWAQENDTNPIPAEYLPAADSSGS